MIFLRALMIFIIIVALTNPGSNTRNHKRYEHDNPRHKYIDSEKYKVY